MLVLVCAIASAAAGDGDRGVLPRPDYHPDQSDPAWLVQVVQYHGHLGPMVVAGARLGAVGRRAAGAKGYFDLEVAVEGPLGKPPQSCLLDGVQVSTGATLGKRSLRWVPAEQIVLRVKNLRTGKTAEVRPTPRVLELLGSLKPRSKTAPQGPPEHPSPVELEHLARQIAAMPDSELATVKLIEGP